MLTLRDKNPVMVRYHVIKASCFITFLWRQPKLFQTFNIAFPQTFKSSTSGFYCVVIAPREVFMHYDSKPNIYFFKILCKKNK